MSEIMAVVPARKGSKRLSGKNMKELGGVPLIGHTLAAALESACCEWLYVTTDCKKTMDYAKSWGAGIIKRPKALSTDWSPSAEAVIHAVEWLRVQGYRPDAVLLLQPTSPLRSAATIRSAVALYAKTGEAVVSVAATEILPPRIRSIRAGRISPYFDEEKATVIREPVVFDGSIYLVPIRKLMQTRSMCPPGTRAIISPPREFCDINTQEDFDLAELRLKRIGNRAIQFRKTIEDQ